MVLSPIQLQQHLQKLEEERTAALQQQLSAITESINLHIEKRDLLHKALDRMTDTGQHPQITQTDNLQRMDTEIKDLQVRIEENEVSLQ